MTSAEAPAVALVVSLDTKGEEAAFLRDLLTAEGQRVLVVDFSVLGEPAFTADFSASEVAQRGGDRLGELRGSHDRGRALDVMAAGVTAIVRELHSRGTLAGVLSIGGSGGTAVATAAMRALPLGIPKVMVSTVASSNVQPYVDTKDICMIHSVADFSGVNPISEIILRNAAGAMAGMVRPQTAAAKTDDRRSRLIAASMFGVTTPAVEKARARLKAAGYELVPFHATGIGGRTMESLIEDGFFTAVLDLTTTEWADEVVGGTLSAGPHRLEAAARKGIPQVVAPGALDMVNFFGPSTVPERFKDRLLHRHNANVILMRTTPAENIEIGRRIAEKLSAATGPVTIFLPLRGVSAMDAAGGVFYDPDADNALFDSLRRHAAPSVRIEAIDANINDDAFAEACCRELLALISKQEAGRAHA